MSDPQPNNPLHGVTLKAILEALVERHGWPGLGAQIKIRCFSEAPNLESCLTFLRKTEWARTKVEQLYLEDLRRAEHNRKRNKRRAAMRAYRAEHEAATADPGAPVADPEAPAPDPEAPAAAPTARKADPEAPAP